MTGHYTNATLSICSGTGLEDLPFVCLDIFANSEQNRETLLHQLEELNRQGLPAILRAELQVCSLTYRVIRPGDIDWPSSSHLLGPSGPANRGGLWQINSYRLTLDEAREDRSGDLALLLIELRRVAAKGPIRSIGKGSPAVGLTLEAELEISRGVGRAANPFGIELSAARLGGTTRRRTLFSRVPEWGIGAARRS